MRVDMMGQPISSSSIGVSKEGEGGEGGEEEAVGGQEAIRSERALCQKFASDFCKK